MDDLQPERGAAPSGPTMSLDVVSKLRALEIIALFIV
jgi:hypothetical protein